MNRDLYSNTEFTELKKRINAEIIRRGGFRWFDPLSTPKIGIDRSSPLSLPETDDERVLVTDKTYTINNPSTDSIVETRNIPWPANGENPAGENPTYDGNEPSTSAAALTVDEIQNFLVGLTKIKDINLFYGRGEVEGVAFRDPQGIEDVLMEAEADELSEIYTDEGVPYTRQDFNGGMKEYENPRYPIDNPLIQEFPKENGIYVLPSGEMDGEETLSYKGPGVDNFFDDYGAEPGDGNYHPFNRGITPRTRRDYWVQDKHRKETRVVVEQGGIHSEVYGANPRNPNQGQPYKSIPAYRGKPSTCQSACTGLCSMTCDSQCSESCSVTCTIRCGNACINECENVCTGCSSLCYSSCQTKCENSTGYACVKSGAVAVRIYTTGGTDGTPAVNHLDVETYTCQGCSYSCQFYPNKKTECWDAGCMGKCFTSCTTACSTSCLGGCTNNDATGTKGQGCQAACTINCSGNCQGTCEGVCVATCYHQCKQTCSDNCSFSCDTICGEGCDNGCTNGCTGCVGTCESYCTGQNDMYGCTGCGTKGGCTSACQFDCNQNCISRGCRSLCGIDNAGACSNNCRISCASSSCTSQCSNQCTDQCTTCVNGCGWQCGACFKEGTLIETINGLTPIEEIQVGDLVLTKSGFYCPVEKTYKRKAKDLITLHGVGAPTIYTTADHPFWIKQYIALKYDPETKKNYQLYSEPKWVCAKDIKPRDKWCLRTRHIGDVSVPPGVAYMVGRWLGDGWRSNTRSWNGIEYPRFSICCGKHEHEDFEHKLEQSRIRYTVSEKRTTFTYRIPTHGTNGYNNKALISYLMLCGQYAYAKEIPEEIYQWNEECLSLLIQGYMDADGHFCDDEQRTFSSVSVSKKLSYGISLILRMLDRNPRWSERRYEIGSTHNIEGRTVNVKTTYSITSQLNDYTRWYSVPDESGDFVWSTVTRIKPPDFDYIVYNITVRDDPTYYADGVLVHNCSSACSVGCESACGLTCTATCEHSCESNCVQSCTEECSGCSNLCYSCISMCIGVCSLTCNGKCSSCANQCSWWCDSKCNQQCFANCVDMCMQSCSNSCSTYVGIHADTPGPERDPTSPDYPNPHPGNRPEERESFKVIPGIMTDDCIDVYADENEHLILAYYGTEVFEPELHPSGRHMILYSRGAPYDIRTSHVHFHDVNGRLIVIITGEK